MSKHKAPLIDRCVDRFRFKLFFTLTVLQILAGIGFLVTWYFYGLMSFTDNVSHEVDVIKSCAGLLNPVLIAQINDSSITMESGALIVLLWPVFVSFIITILISACLKPSSQRVKG